MKASELIELLKRSPHAQVFIAGYMDVPEEANSVLFADEFNSDDNLAFCDYGDSLGEKAILICNEDLG